MGSSEPSSSNLRWRVQRGDQFVLLEFELPGDGLLRPEQLREVRLPITPEGDGTRGVVFSGRGPVWLYAHLAHQAHPFAWAGVHDPRLGAAVVVQSHTPGRTVGELVPLPGAVSR